MDLQTKNSVIETLEEHKKLIWPEVRRSLRSPLYPDDFRIAKKYKSLEKFHWEVVKEYPSRKGKYIRPTLTILTVGALGGNPRLALKTAAALQLSEEWLLVHDDIEDDSILRRGKLTLHKIYGIGLAVNAGDVLQAAMWKLLLDNVALLGFKKTKRILEEFYRFLMRTLLGQTTEMKYQIDPNLGFSNLDWYFIADGKTGYYSFAAPLRLAGLIKEVSAQKLCYLTEFGLELGRCFQLVDDILDVTSDFKGLKQRGNDIYEGKRTVLLGHLYRSLGTSERNKLLSILIKTRDQKTQKEVDWIIAKMQEHKSIEYARKLAKIHKERSLQIFNKKLGFLRKEPERTKIYQLVEFLVERDY